MSEEQKVAIPEGEYAKYLANLAAELADTKTRAREIQWRTVAGAIVSILAIFGYSNFSSLSKNIDDRLSLIENKFSAQMAKDMPDRVREYIENNKATLLGKVVADMQSDVDARMALLQLVVLSTELTKGDGFTKETREAVVAMLETVSASTALVNSPQFAKALEDVVDVFLKADQATYIDKIDDKLRSVISLKQGITFSMVQHYGMKVLGAGAQTPSDVERLQHYAEAASIEFNSPEVPAAYLLALAFVNAQDKRDNVGLAIVQDAHHWTDQEKHTFVGTISWIKDGQFYKRPTGKTERIEALFNRVYIAYEKDLLALLRPATTSVQPGDNSSDRETRKSLTPEDGEMGD